MAASKGPTTATLAAIRSAIALERIAFVLERLALKAGANLSQASTEVDESALGEQPSLTPEEEALLRELSPPVPPAE